MFNAIPMKNLIAQESYFFRYQFKQLMVGTEGISFKPYKGENDSVMLIGIGHKIKPGEHFTELSLLTIDKVFDKDYEYCYSRALKSFPHFELFPNEWKLLIMQMIFSHGYTGFLRYKHLIQHINDKDWEKAKSCIKLYVWYKKNKKVRDFYKF